MEIIETPPTTKNPPEQFTGDVWLDPIASPREEGQRIAVVVNVPTSTMAREADLLLPTHAGPEIGVASTKAF